MPNKTGSLDVGHAPAPESPENRAKPYGDGPIKSRRTGRRHGAATLRPTTRETKANEWPPLGQAIKRPSRSETRRKSTGCLRSSVGEDAAKQQKKGDRRTKKRRKRRTVEINEEEGPMRRRNARNGTKTCGECLADRHDAGQ